MLIRWTKDPQPIVARPPAGLDITGFRDPSVWKQGDRYFMTVGSGIAKAGGCVLLYQSHDLRQWEYLHELTRGQWNGKKTGNPCEDGEMWECPEFFALGDAAGGGHVLIYSTLGKVFWESGVLETEKFTMRKRGELDWGAFYAPKTQLDAAGRRILWGWIPERRSESAMKAAGWSGMMSLPRVMSLDSDGTLRLKVLPQASVLRGEELPKVEAKTGSLRRLPQATGEAMGTGMRGKDMTVRLSDGSSSLVEVSYSAADHTMTADGHTLVLEPGDVPSVHAFVDGSVVELILGERIGYTKRFYYTAATAPDIVVSASEGVLLQAWKVMQISTDRLTKTAVG
jgi:beta-fructofuranosidase